MVMNILWLDLAIISVSKHLNRMEEIPTSMAANSVNPRVSLLTLFLV